MIILIKISERVPTMWGSAASVPNVDQEDDRVANHKMINSPADSVRAVLVLVHGHRGGLDVWSSMIIGREVGNHLANHSHSHSHRAPSASASATTTNIPPQTKIDRSIEQGIKEGESSQLASVHACMKWKPDLTNS